MVHKTVNTVKKKEVIFTEMFLESASPDVEPNKYESLLKNIDRLYPDLAEKIERLSKPSQQTTKGKQWLGSKKRLMMKAKSAKRNSIKP